MFRWLKVILRWIGYIILLPVLFITSCVIRRKEKVYKTEYDGTRFTLYAKPRIMEPKIHDYFFSFSGIRPQLFYYAVWYNEAIIGKVIAAEHVKTISSNMKEHTQALMIDPAKYSYEEFEKMANCLAAEYKTIVDQTTTYSDRNRIAFNTIIYGTWQQYSIEYNTPDNRYYMTMNMGNVHTLSERTYEGERLVTHSVARVSYTDGILVFTPERQTNVATLEEIVQQLQHKDRGYLQNDFKTKVELQ